MSAKASAIPAFATRFARCDEPDLRGLGTAPRSTSAMPPAARQRPRASWKAASLAREPRRQTSSSARARAARASSPLSMRAISVRACSTGFAVVALLSGTQGDEQIGVVERGAHHVLLDRHHGNAHFCCGLGVAVAIDAHQDERLAALPRQAGKARQDALDRLVFRFDKVYEQLATATKTHGVPFHGESLS